MGKLNPLKIKGLSQPGKYGDGGNLWLQIGRNGSKSWLVRFRLNGRSRAMGLGPVDIVPLAEARELAQQARRDLRAGRDPIEHRKAQRGAARLEAARAISFKDAAERYVAAHEAAWRNSKHRAQWRSTLAAYAYPEIGSLPVSAIDTTLMLRVLEPIWTKRPETAGRVRGRVEAVLDWAAARGYRPSENPARWRGHLDKLLPARSKIAPVKHYAAMPYADLPAFVAELRRRDGISAPALEFTILTAGRTGETIGARWSEIDCEARIWTVPASRMKSSREHRVPLGDRCMAILAVLPRIEGCEYLFPGTKLDSSISNMAMAELLKGMRLGLTVHGFRSTFKDWATEATDHARDIVEAALAHVLGDKVEAAYRRGDALAKRRLLMEDWAEFCARRADRALAGGNGGWQALATQGELSRTR